MSVPQYAATSADADEARRLLLKAWQYVLSHDGPITDSDDFFELGGHSLLALHVIGILSDELEMDVPVQILFDYPTLGPQAAALAELLASESRG
jgi:fengycin family lipopeptide synthetase E